MSTAKPVGLDPSEIDSDSDDDEGAKRVDALQNRCVVKDCKELRSAKGYCTKHQNRRASFMTSAGSIKLEWKVEGEDIDEEKEGGDEIDARLKPPKTPDNKHLKSPTSRNDTRGSSISPNSGSRNPSLLEMQKKKSNFQRSSQELVQMFPQKKKSIMVRGIHALTGGLLTNASKLIKGKPLIGAGMDIPEESFIREDTVIDPGAPYNLPSDSIEFWNALKVRHQEAQDFEDDIGKNIQTLGQDVSGTDAEFEEYKNLVLKHAANDEFAELPTLIQQIIKHKSILHLDLERSQTLAQTNSGTHLADVKTKMIAHDETKTKHNTKMQKYLAMKTTGDHKILAQKDKKLGLRRQELELQRFDLDSSLRQLEENREYAVLAPLSAALDAWFRFFERGQSMLKPYKETRAKLMEAVRTLKVGTGLSQIRYEEARLELERQLQAYVQHADGNQHGTGVRDLDTDSAIVKVDSTVVTKEGYLYIPEPKFKAVWVTIADGNLVVTKPSGSLITLPLMLCTVKENRQLKLRFVFSVVSVQETVTLQAESENDMSEWLQIIQNAISQQLHGVDHNDSGKTEEERAEATEKARDERERRVAALKLLREHPGAGNQECADCRQSNPDWASLNIGIMMCVGCSGVHRSLGTHISKVRSLALDNVDPFTINYIKNIGNKMSNEIFEHSLHNLKDAQRPKPSDNRAVRETWIRSKYNNKMFMKKCPKDQLDKDGKGSTGTDVFKQFDAALKVQSLKEMLQCLAWGADITDKKLLVTALKASETAPAAGVDDISRVLGLDFLILNNYDVINHIIIDTTHNRNVLHCAAALNHCVAVHLLLCRGPGLLILQKDKDGKTALDIAKETWKGKTDGKSESDETGFAYVLALLEKMMSEQKVKDAEKKERIQRASINASSPKNLPSLPSPSAKKSSKPLPKTPK